MSRPSTSNKIAMEASGDESFPDNTTCLTGNTSEHSYTIENIRRFGGGFSLESAGPTGGAKAPIRMRCGRYIWLTLVLLLSLLGLTSPLVMVLLPKVLSAFAATTTNTNSTSNSGGGSAPLTRWNTSSCQVDCQGMLLSFAFKWTILLIGVWALFCRRAAADLPRLQLARACVMAFLFMLLFAYWLFYLVRVVLPAESDYAAIVSFALSLVDALLFLHYLTIVLLELRRLRSEFKVHVVRSPDGESRVYHLGFTSIQQAAAFVLHNYYRDFPLYNPFLERLPGGGRRMGHKGSGASEREKGGGFKLYNVDGGGGAGGEETMGEVNTQALILAASRRRETAQSHNERFYEELDWERRVRKRKARLVGATEDAFSHVTRLLDHQQKGVIPCEPMDSEEAARAIFPAIARPLTKFLRVTRQQPRHSAEQVVAHLARCLTFDASPKTFLERFFSPLETADAPAVSRSSWSILSEQLASSGVAQNTTFLLRCHSEGADGNVQLWCTVSKLPFLNLKEELYQPRQQRFTLKLSSETSV